MLVFFAAIILRGIRLLLLVFFAAVILRCIRLLLLVFFAAIILRRIRLLLLVFFAAVILRCIRLLLLVFFAAVILRCIRLLLLVFFAAVILRRIRLLLLVFFAAIVLRRIRLWCIGLRCWRRRWCRWCGKYRQRPLGKIEAVVLAGYAVGHDGVVAGIFCTLAAATKAHGAAQHSAGFAVNKTAVDQPIATTVGHAVVGLGGVNRGYGQGCLADVAGHTDNVRSGKAVVTAHAGDCAGTNREAGRATGADAAGRRHVGRVVVELQCAGVEYEAVTRHRTTDAAVDGRCTGHRAAIVGLAQAAADAGGRTQCRRCDRRSHVFAAGVEHVVVDCRALAAADAGDGQACYGHLAGVCHVGAVIGGRAVAERCSAVTSDKSANGVDRREATRCRFCSVVDLAHSAVADRGRQCGRDNAGGHILAAGVKHVVADCRAPAATDAGENQA